MHKILALILIVLISFVVRVEASCLAFARSAEIKYGIPEGLLIALLTVESRSSPWAVNTTDSSRFFKNKKDARTYIEKRLREGCPNINIGCGQINWNSHKHKFKKDMNKLLDPSDNVLYTASYLRELYNVTKCWKKAVRRYNSPSHGAAYQAKVYQIWKRNQMKAMQAHLVEIKLAEQAAQIQPKKHRKIQVGLGKEKK